MNSPHAMAAAFVFLGFFVCLVFFVFLIQLLVLRPIAEILNHLLWLSGVEFSFSLSLRIPLLDVEVIE